MRLFFGEHSSTVIGASELVWEWHTRLRSLRDTLASADFKRQSQPPLPGASPTCSPEPAGSFEPPPDPIDETNRLRTSGRRRRRVMSSRGFRRRKSRSRSVSPTAASPNNQELSLSVLVRFPALGANELKNRLLNYNGIDSTLPASWLLSKVGWT